MVALVKMIGKAQLKARLGFIRTVMAGKAYAMLFLVFLSAYLGLNFFVNRFYETLPNLLSFRLSVVLPYTIITLLIGIGVALNMTIIAYKLRQVLGVRKELGFTFVGMFGGFLGGACPGCFVGVFPALAGAFGITATLGSLPFLGFELLVPTLIIVLATLYIIANPLTCKVKDGKGKKK